jgi:hypothetical protein
MNETAPAIAGAREDFTPDHRGRGSCRGHQYFQTAPSVKTFCCIVVRLL